jgi:glyoxylase-like metal-dependent hydrolase (beta-lactamase superfamily II)
VKIHPIQTGTVAIHQRQRVGHDGPLRQLKMLTDRNWTEPLPIFAWLIEHPEGLIVVDTGETARAAQPGYYPAWHPYFRFAMRLDVREEDEIGPQLRALGFSPDDVRWVVLTHLHTDHAGGLAHFPDSEILVTHEEWDHATGRRGRLRGYPNRHWPDWLKPRLVSAPDTVTAAGDVRLLPTPGHTPGHVSVTVEDGHSFVILAGDTSYTDEMRLDGVSPDAKAAKATLERLQQLIDARGATYLPSHDPQAPARLQALG